jgi:hypothetical protein
MTATPVGDWIAKRYPPNDGATHYLGTGDDPGCCAGPHPACTYSAAFREGAAAERERCAQLADTRRAVCCGASDKPHACDYDDVLLPFGDVIRGQP